MHLFDNGAQFIRLDYRFWNSPAIKELPDYAQIVAVAFLDKVRRDTLNGQYPRPIPFSYDDVRDRGISKSSVRRALIQGEGVFCRKVSQGGGKAKNHYEPSDGYLTSWNDSAHREKHVRHLEHGTVVGQNAEPSQAEHGLAINLSSSTVSTLISNLGNGNTRGKVSSPASDSDYLKAATAIIKACGGDADKESTEVQNLFEKLKTHGDLDRARQVYKGLTDSMDPKNYLFVSRLLRACFKRYHSLT